MPFLGRLGWQRAIALAAFAAGVGAAPAAHATPRQALVLAEGEHVQSLQVLCVIRPPEADAGSPQSGFAMTFATGLDSLILASTWPATRTLRILDEIPAAGARGEMAAESMSGFSLVLEASFLLSADRRTAVMLTAATLYDQAGNTAPDVPRYRADFVYASAPAPGSGVEERARNWAAENGARLHRAADEGVHETLALLAADVFSAQCGPFAAASATEEFEADDPRSGTGNGWRGSTVAHTESRLRVRRADGNLFSVPAEYRKPVFVFRQEDFQFRISYRPDDRACVQVDHPSGHARVWLDPVAVAEQENLSPRRLTLVLDAVTKREAELRAAWDRVHAERLRARSADGVTR